VSYLFLDCYEQARFIVDVHVLFSAFNAVKAMAVDQLAARVCCFLGQSRVLDF
jgi:hypothetical protein